LGVWQLRRLGERRAFNRTLLARLESPIVPVASLLGATGDVDYRRVTARGVLLYDREVVWAGRTRSGSPGVNLLTPMRVEGGDSLVLVNRGWAYSPNAAAVDLGRWRERDTVAIAGFVERYRPTGGARATRPRTHLALDHDAIAADVGAPLAHLVLVQTSDSAARADSVPDRITAPSLDEGSHLNYAIQWFAFTAISWAGGFLVSFRSQRGKPSDPPVPH
jgi:surfeit locus 1 family protein